MGLLSALPRAETEVELGYRLGIDLRSTFWFTEKLGLYGSVGIAHLFALVNPDLGAPPDLSRSGRMTRQWHTEMTLQLGLSYRFE